MLSLQTLAVPAQLPALHTSLAVQALPSLQLPPSTTATKAHLPLTVSQLSVVHALLSLQTVAMPAQVPVVQVSGVVQALPSSQAVPLATAL